MERTNQDLEAALRYVTAQNPAEWAVHLPYVEYAHDSLTTSATVRSPFEVVLGYNCLCSQSRRGNWQFPWFRIICSILVGHPTLSLSLCCVGQSPAAQVLAGAIRAAEFNAATIQLLFSLADPSLCQTIMLPINKELSVFKPASHSPTEVCL